MRRDSLNEMRERENTEQEKERVRFYTLAIHIINLPNIKHFEKVRVNLYQKF